MNLTDTSNINTLAAMFQSCSPRFVTSTAIMA